MTGDAPDVEGSEALAPAVPAAGNPGTAEATGPTDSLVETALRLLPVPDHAPGFWEDLGASLATQPRRQAHEPPPAVGPGRPATPTAAPPAPGGARAEAAPDASRRLIPPSLRSRTNAVLLALAVAAAVLVVVCGAALLRSRSDAGLGPRQAETTAAAHGTSSTPSFAIR